jgi:hypothetical protein
MQLESTKKNGRPLVLRLKFHSVYRDILYWYGASRFYDKNMFLLLEIVSSISYNY